MHDLPIMSVAPSTNTRVFRQFMFKSAATVVVDGGIFLKSVDNTHGVEAES